MPRDPNIGVGVCIVLYNQEKKVLMIKRGSELAKGTWAFPGGWKEKKETLLQRAQKEAEEEVGVKVLAAYHIGATSEEHPDKDYETVSVYFAAKPPMWKGEPMIPEAEKEKILEIQWVDPKNLPEPLFPGIDQIKRFL